MDGHRLLNERVAAPEDSPEVWTDRNADGVRYLDELGELNPEIAVLTEAERFQTQIAIPEFD